MSRRSRNGIPTGALIVLVSLAAVLCIVLGTLMYLDNRALIRNKEDDEKITQDQAKSYVKQDMPGTEASGEEEVSAEEADFYENLLPADKEVNIEELKNTVNPDIYAWLYIPDTGIDDAILQHPEDVTFYSTHNSEGKEDEDGAVYTQLFNNKDFSDNVTVVYGHNGGNDKGFSKLSLYEDPEFFKSHPYIYVYTDGAILLYQTFAAYESDDKLIVLFYSTNEDNMYNIYLQRLEEIAGVSYNVNKECWPGYGDKILTLSTGVTGKDDRRLLVQARFLGGFVEDSTNE
ncbi:MAG: class B sortase [Lachnospiraceae bacterium]|nr:class B sortase [Lachnospiraceae bacterium]